MINAHMLSRAIRQPGTKAPVAGDEGPPAFMVAPTSCARAAVRVHHTDGPKAAKSYFAGTKVAEWVNHGNPSMASGASAVIDGLDWYLAADAARGCPMTRLDAQAIVSLQPGLQVSARLDVVLDDGPDLAGRVVLWDGPRLTTSTAPVIACAFAHALSDLYPGRGLTTIGVWQGRRQQAFEVPVSEALAHSAAAAAALADM